MSEKTVTKFDRLCLKAELMQANLLAQQTFFEKHGEPLYCGFAWVDVPVTRTKVESFDDHFLELLTYVVNEVLMLNHHSFHYFEILFVNIIEFLNCVQEDITQIIWMLILCLKRQMNL